MPNQSPLKLLFLEVRSRGVYRKLRMSIGLQRCRVHPVSLVQAMACFVSMLMLLTFPIHHRHHFSDHFRTREIRSSIERHTFASRSETDDSDRVFVRETHGIRLVLNYYSDVRKFTDHSESQTDLPPARLLMRLKRGSSRTASPDPLLL